VFVAASTRTFAATDFFEACRTLTDLEFDKVEIWFDEGGPHLKPSVVTADPERFQARFREQGRLSPVAFWLGCEVPLDQFAALSKLAKQLRITQMTVPASPLGTPFNAEIDRLRAYLQIASQDGIRVSIPTHIGALTEDPRTAVELCQATPGLGLTLDPSHYIAGPCRGVPYELTFPHVYHVHLRDSSPEAIQVTVGLGEIDYSRLITQLNRVRYNRALSVDFDGTRLSPEEVAGELRKLRRLLETLL
jgi:sugar phosphate isomerase/epimerase